MTKLDLLFRPMQEDDLDQVMAIERVSFSSPWSRASFENEIEENSLARYWVAEDIFTKNLVGYAGIWLIFDEVHITTIAIDPRFRAKGLGKMMLEYVFLQASLIGGEKITLEVRPSNEPAMHLYSKMGFDEAGRRKGYYSDTGEDAIIMWKELKNLQQ